MAINRSSISAQSIRENTDLTIEILNELPNTSAYLDTPVTPNVLFGFYNHILDKVQLYVSDPTGRRFLKIF